MDRLLTVIQRLLILAVWVGALFIISIGIIRLTSMGGYYDDTLVKDVVNQEGFMEGFAFTVGGLLFGFVGTKLVNWIFNKE